MEGKEIVIAEGRVQQSEKQQQQPIVTKKKSKNKKKNFSSETVTTTSTVNSSTKKKKSRTNVCGHESKVTENGLSHHLKEQLQLDEQVNGLVETLDNINKKQSTMVKQLSKCNSKLIDNSTNNTTVTTIMNAITTTTIAPASKSIQCEDINVQLKHFNSNEMEKSKPAFELNGHHVSSVSTSALSLLNDRCINECDNVIDNVTATTKKNKRKANHKKQRQNYITINKCNNNNSTTNKQENENNHLHHSYCDSHKIDEAVTTVVTEAETAVPCSNCRSLTTYVYNKTDAAYQNDRSKHLINGYTTSAPTDKCSVQTVDDLSSHDNSTITTASNNCNSLSASTTINDKKCFKADNINSSNNALKVEQQQAHKLSETTITTLMPDLSNAHIEYKEYESELQMHDIMRLIQAELSEPYSIYTYRYFIYNWPKLCFLAAHGNDYVGAIVCKLDMHLNVRRGYIAMLAVRKEYRKLKIGTTLVQKAIEAMLADNADEVVLETEMSNVPALRLYENLGFVRDKRLFRYYLNGVDALRLKLWFR